MARKNDGLAGRWSKTTETRRTLLAAAREVFAEHGFSNASISDIVNRAGSSVGSVYHHFGGKAELFLALWTDYQETQWSAAAAAVGKAKAGGEDDPLELFIVGTRTFLEGAWQRRDLAGLFLSGDSPPGFALIWRARGHEWIRQNSTLLGTGSGPVDRLTVTVLTTIIGEASREISGSRSKRQANRIIDATEVLLRRLNPLEPPA